MILSGCARDQCQYQRERERKSRVCLERPLFHSPRQTDTYSLSLHNRGGKQKYNTHITKNTYILSQKQKTIYYTTIFSKKNQKRTTALHSTIVPHPHTSIKHFYPSTLSHSHSHSHSLSLSYSHSQLTPPYFSHSSLRSSPPPTHQKLVPLIFQKKWLLCLTIVRAYYSL